MAFKVVARLGYDPYLTAADIARFGVEKVEFDELLQESDFITLHAPLTAETEHMFGLKEFQKMKSTAVIINTARGPIIDSQVLYEFLKDGSIAGAGLDVTEPEPLRPDDPILELAEVLITAHSAYFSETSNRELQEKATQAVILALQGIYPPTLINPEVKEQPDMQAKALKKRRGADEFLLETSAKEPAGEKNARKRFHSPF